MLSEKKILEVLTKWNFWEKELETGIDRIQYVQELQKFINRKEVIVLKGIRRSGKSTIMKQLIKRLILQNVEKKQTLYINLESYEFSNHRNLKLLDKILTVYRKKINTNKKIYFFIDEIQLIPEWERFVRTLYDRTENIKFFVSGSNASLLSKELSTLLTGRNITFEVKPLTYTEYKNFTLTPQIKEYMEFGGFPEVVLEQDIYVKKKLIQQYFEDIINKDIVQRHKIKNSADVLNLAKYLVENSGASFSINNLSKALNLDYKSVDNYISAMKDAYFLVQVNHFSYSLKTKFNKNMKPKFYVSDNGFFNIINTNKKNTGQKFENIVLTQLNKKYNEILFWQEKTEVDFIVENKAFNVTIDFKNIKKREYDGLINFKEKYKIKDLNLITLNKSYETHKDIKIISYDEFCEI